MLRVSQEEADNSVYILVHGDDFAISKSMIRKDGERLKQTIRTRCRLNVKKSIPIIYTELDCDDPPLPAYLEEFDSHIIRVANQHTGNLHGQIETLKQVLLRFRTRSHYTFSGGWRDACLRFTVNNVAFRRPRLIVNEERMQGVEAAVLQYPGYRDRNITVEVDWPNVF